MRKVFAPSLCEILFRVEKFSQSVRFLDKISTFKKEIKKPKKKQFPFLPILFIKFLIFLATPSCYLPSWLGIANVKLQFFLYFKEEINWSRTRATLFSRWFRRCSHGNWKFSRPEYKWLTTVAEIAWLGMSRVSSRNDCLCPSMISVCYPPTNKYTVAFNA